MGSIYCGMTAGQTAQRSVRWAKDSVRWGKDYAEAEGLPVSSSISALTETMLLMREAFVPTV